MKPTQKFILWFILNECNTILDIKMLTRINTRCSNIKYIHFISLSSFSRKKFKLVLRLAHVVLTVDKSDNKGICAKKTLTAQINVSCHYLANICMPHKHVIYTFYFDIVK